jgi:hypothetical protein
LEKRPGPLLHYSITPSLRCRGIEDEDENEDEDDPSYLSYNGIFIKSLNASAASGIKVRG